MAAFAAFLRAINVGGTGKLAMAELRRLCAAQGFQDVSTYIQSGNVVFTSSLSEAKVKQRLEKALATELGKSVGVLVRSRAELRSLLRKNPFEDAPKNRVIVLLLDEAPPKAALSGVVGPGGEELELRGREIFIYYPDGQGRSKLKLPFFKTGTGRNLNTIAKLSQMVAELEG